MSVFKTEFLNNVNDEKYSEVKSTINDYIKAVFREKVDNRKKEIMERIKSGEKI